MIDNINIICEGLDRFTLWTIQRMNRYYSNCFVKCHFRYYDK